jgi:hypothetical protein
VTWFTHTPSPRVIYLKEQKRETEGDNEKWKAKSRNLQERENTKKTDRKNRYGKPAVIVEVRAACDG